MKTFKLMPLVILFISVFAVSCDKDDDPVIPVYPQENPIQGYLNASGFAEEETESTNEAAQEFGYSFRPTVTGAITSLAVRIPDVNNNLRVTVWDLETGEVIKTELFNVTSSGVVVNKTIPALALIKDREYMVTMNSGDSYEHSKTNDSDAIYPFTVGNIQVTGFGYSIGAGQTLPYIFPVNYYRGDLSFTFQRTL